jgi:uncharacterized protein (DUF305 family)
MLKSLIACVSVGTVVLLATACVAQNAPVPVRADANATRLTNAPPEGSADVMFARAMMAHHAQAVEMSLNLRDRSSNPELRTLALDIILTQQNQIGQMQGWLAAWDVPITGKEPPMQGMASMMGMATQPQVNALRTLPISEAEKSFLELMIRHHQGGIAMANDALQRAQRPEVLRLANAIVKGQQSEIEYMQELLSRRDSQSLDATPMPTSTAMSMNH